MSSRSAPNSAYFGDIKKKKMEYWPFPFNFFCSYLKAFFLLHKMTFALQIFSAFFCFSETAIKRFTAQYFLKKKNIFFSLQHFGGWRYALSPDVVALDFFVDYWKYIVKILSGVWYYCRPGCFTVLTSFYCRFTWDL